MPKRRGGAVAFLGGGTYDLDMARADEAGFDQSEGLLDLEEDLTLRAIDRGVKAADEGRVMTSEDARRRIEEWLTRSSTPKTR